MEKRGAWVMPHDLAVRRGGSFHPSVAAVVGCTYARVAAWWAGAPIVHRDVYQVAIKNGSVGRCPDGFPVELHLLFGVPELQGARALVWRRLLPVREGDGRGKVDLMLHVRVGGLEATETVPLHKRRGGKPVPGPWSIHDLQQEERHVTPPLSTALWALLHIYEELTEWKMLLFATCLRD